MVRVAQKNVYKKRGKLKPPHDWNESAIVDPELRVRGIRGVRVADATIKILITSANTNPPVIMIGEKVAKETVEYPIQCNKFPNARGLSALK